MPARARFETAARDGSLADLAGIDRMRAAPIALAGAEAGEGRFVDAQADVRIVRGEDALLAVAEPALRDGQLSAFEANACPVAIGHGDVGEDQADHRRTVAAEHERALALAGDPRKRGFARLRCAVGYPAGALDCTFVIGAGREHDRALAPADRIDRAL